MKMKIVAMALSGIIGSTLALPSLSVEPLDSAQAHSNRWFSMYDQLEFKRLAEAYSDDAVVLAPASTRLQGREAVADYWQRVSKMNGKVSVAISSADVDGRQMIENGVWGVEMTTASGEVVRQGGNLLRVMEQVEDGSWKIKMESWN